MDAPATPGSQSLHKKCSDIYLFIYLFLRIIMNEYFIYFFMIVRLSKLKKLNGNTIIIIR